SVARNGKALGNQPLALGFSPLHDLSTLHCLHMKFGLDASSNPRRGDKYPAMSIEWPSKVSLQAQGRCCRVLATVLSSSSRSIAEQTPPIDRHDSAGG